ncbi:3-isopropylmalate dehydratase [Chryseobacterium glaciei]|uniref:3-isopropylmalate dehydratase n=1 Tax=Chryseobacterium glaciei TaxID=1685010 RepID=A0A172Y1K4_9FLAO|nr:3-isopropylmalate dehydratase [Chryseobacterium glaciei]ANF52935.1 3-isopropylmalate dehydratase [Chryseobacterium glaciei]
MQITDLNGFEIEVTDLKEAIKQAKNLKDLHHNPPVPSDKERQQYWKDLYEKLVTLKSKIRA